jgi:hypothetical protein
MSLKELPIELDILQENFTHCRAYFPYMSPRNIGAEEMTTAPYYISRGFHITFQFNQPLNEAHISKNNEIAAWINQNFIIRLYALLESCSVTNKIDKSIDGWKDVDLVRRLRNVFMHKNGKYDPTDSRHKNLAEELKNHLGVSEILNNGTEFGLSIDTGIDPLFYGCKRYVQGLIRRQV